MHESTISRVTSGKYMHTPRGVFELRYFFSSQVEGADGSGTSSTAIRAKIRKLVKDEDPEAPLSDGRIAELLSGRGHPGGAPHGRQVSRSHGHRALERAPPRGIETNVSALKSRVEHNEQETAMQLNVTGHHVEVTASLRGYVEKKLERIGRHFDQVIDVHCVLTVEKLRQKAEATLHVSGNAIHADAIEDRHVRRHRLAWPTSSTAASRSTRKSAADHHAAEAQRRAAVRQAPETCIDGPRGYH